MARRTATMVTSNPDQPAPSMTCQTCDKTLVYQQTVFGGIDPPERWDYYVCNTCGDTFRYRLRTRRLSKLPRVHV
jgi:RNase P subunit RPR2